MDTETVDYAPRFLRLDQAVFAEASNFDATDVAHLNEAFGDFFGVYTQEIMQMPPPDNPMLPEFLNRFTSDPIWQRLQTTIKEVHPDLDAQEIRITEALKRYSVHFDRDTLPALVAYNSGFNVGIYPSSNYLGVGLEWYSGSENPIVKQLPPDLFPQYKRDKMKPRYLVPNTVKGWLFYTHQNLVGETLLEQMAFRGKMLFITKVLTEDTEANILNFSEAELEWCRESEYDIWDFFLKEDLLFSSDLKQINKILNDGPFTPGMPLESPGGVGNWVGLRMVEAFMEDNDEVSLKSLLQVDEQRILKYYKPGR